ncbi:hypothetical protein VTN31DRAFT_5236 [Thermomyces dupontii]|uniref:uncharacterized protein n=1 Tax=Talaromyces thermophilus TaxID=28565 RepID=UPI0037431EAC
MNASEHQSSEDDLLCRTRALVVITSQPSDPLAEKVQFTGFIPIVSNFDYLLGVPREQELPIQVTYPNPMLQPLVDGSDEPRPSLLQDTCVQVSGYLHIDYDHEGKPHLSLAATSVRPALEDSTSITESVGEPCIDCLVGVVVGIPVERPECRVYTLRVFAGHCSCSDCVRTCWKGMTHHRWYDVYCVAFKSARLANRRWPQINDACALIGFIVGLYKVGDSVAPLIELAAMNARPSQERG